MKFLFSLHIGTFVCKQAIPETGHSLLYFFFKEENGKRDRVFSLLVVERKKKTENGGAMVKDQDKNQ